MIEKDGLGDHSTVSELAQHLGKHRDTVERWINQGLIPPPAYISSYGWRLFSPQQVTAIRQSMRSGRPTRGTA